MAETVGIDARAAGNGSLAGDLRTGQRLDEAPGSFLVLGRGGHADLPAAERHERREHDLVELVPFLGLVVPDLVRTRQDCRADLARDLRLLGIGGDDARIAPADRLGGLAAGYGRVDLAEGEVQRVRRRELGGADIFLEALYPAWIVDLGIHRIRIEEHRAGIARMVGIRRSMGEEEPELLAATAEGFSRAPQALVGTLEELRDVEILLPGLRDGEIVAVFGLEGVLLLRVLEKIDAIGVGMDVAIHGLGQHLAVE